MGRLLAGLAISVGICIGPFAASLSFDTKGQVKGDVNYSKGGFVRGRNECLLNCDQNYPDGTGSYRAMTVGEGIQTRAKVYENGAMSVDWVVSDKVCDKSGVFCLKGAVSKRLVDNFDKKESSIHLSRSLSDISLKPDVITPNSLRSFEVVERRSPSQPILSRPILSSQTLAADIFSGATQSKRNEGAKKRGKQVYRFLKASDPLFRSL